MIDKTLFLVSLVGIRGEVAELALLLSKDEKEIDSRRFSVLASLDNIEYHVKQMKKQVKQ